MKVSVLLLYILIFRVEHHSCRKTQQEKKGFKQCNPQRVSPKHEIVEKSITRLRKEAHYEKQKQKQSGGLPLVGGTLFPGGRVVKA